MTDETTPKSKMTEIGATLFVFSPAETEKPILRMTDTELLDALDRWAREHSLCWHVVKTPGPESGPGITADYSESRWFGVRAVIRSFLYRDGNWK